MSTLRPSWLVTVRLSHHPEASEETIEVNTRTKSSARAEARRQRPGYVVLRVERKEAA